MYILFFEIPKDCESNINRYVNKNYELRDNEELPTFQKLIEQKLWNIHPITLFILCFQQYSWQMAREVFMGVMNVAVGEFNSQYVAKWS